MDDKYLKLRILNLHNSTYALIGYTKIFFKYAFFDKFLTFCRSSSGSYSKIRHVPEIAPAERFPCFCTNFRNGGFIKSKFLIVQGNFVRLLMPYLEKRVFRPSKSEISDYLTGA